MTNFNAGVSAYGKFNQLKYITGNVKRNHVNHTVAKGITSLQ
jgi:hypothetical protein